MSLQHMAELGVAVLLLAAGVFFYRRRDKTDTYGSQGAVLLFVAAVILAIHALGLMDYHPSAVEADMMRARSQ